MVSIEKTIGLTILGGIVAALAYKIISTPQTAIIQQQPTQPITERVEYVSYPSPYPVPYTPPEEDYPYTEGTSQEDSLDLALNYVMTQPPYTTLSCTMPACTDVDTLRTPYAWRFKFEFTCDPLAVVRIAYVTVVNGIVTDFSVTP